MLAIQKRSVLVAGCLLVLGIRGEAQTARLSVGPGGVQSNGFSGNPSISSDGRLVAFASVATNLVAADTNGFIDVFVLDRQNMAVERVSVDSSAAQANQGSNVAAISGDGRFVAFDSLASNLVAGDTNGVGDVFVRDRLLGLTPRVSVDPAGGNANGQSHLGSISADGRFVAFESDASNLVPGDTNQTRDVFVRDLVSGITERVSVDSAGIQGDSGSFDESVSGDGRFVAFASSASNLVAGDTNLQQDIFVHDRLTGATEIVSVSSSGAAADALSRYTSISSDGRHVAFVSGASTLVAGDTNGFFDIFVRDRQLGTTRRASVSSLGGQSDGYFSLSPSISGDGRYVAFMSQATSLVAGDTNFKQDVFIHDNLFGLTERVSVGASGAQGDDDSDYSALSRDGRYVVFHSASSNLVTGDTNATTDVFGRDWPGNIALDLCLPGSLGVIDCPCGNPPSGLPRGCDNSSATGGGLLSSSGSPTLSLDTLLFTTSYEKPTTTSIVLQGTTELPGGVVFGQGVRCAGGVLKRLYVKAAAGGSISAPGPGDPSVSVRSAALGDAIGAGTTRLYCVYYRDPVILGGCPSTSTFNVTQTQLVIWWS